MCVDAICSVLKVVSTLAEVQSLKNQFVCESAVKNWFQDESESTHEIFIFAVCTHDTEVNV